MTLAPRALPVSGAPWLHKVPMTGRIVAVVVVAVLPLLAALVLDAYTDEQQASAGLATRTKDLEARVAVREESAISEMHGFLRPLAALAEVREGGLAECAPVLQEARGAEPRLAALAVFDNDTVLCRGDGSADAAPFLLGAVHSAQRQGAFAVAPAEWDDRVQDWVVPFALPVDAEAPNRTIAASLHLGSLRARMATLAASEGAHVLIFTPSGDLVLGTPPVPANESDALYETSTKASGPWRASPQGAPYIYTVRSMQSDDLGTRGLIVVGLPLGPVEAVTDRILLARGALGLSALGLGGVLATWTMRATIRAPLQAIEGASRRVTAGDLGARMDVPGAPREFQALESSFNAMAQTMEGLERSKTELFNHISHQVRTPLTRLILSQDVLRRALESGDLEAASRNAATSRRAAEELRNKTEKLDALAQVLLTRRSAPFQTLDLQGLAGEVRQAAAKVTHDVAITWEVEGDEHAVVSVQAPSLRRAVFELVENALLHGSPRDVRVTVRAGPREVRIEVSDAGAGMPAHAVDALRAPLLQGHFSDIADTGFGIGLSLARLVAQLQGGRLEVSPLSPAAQGPTGTAVALVLPRVD